MAPTRNNPPPNEADSGSDDAFDSQKLTSYGDAMKTIEKLKAQRTEARNAIIRDYKEELEKIRSRLEKEHYAKCDALSTLMSDGIQRLFNAIDKKSSCEEKILLLMSRLRQDRDHLSILIDAVYQARMDSAKDLRVDDLMSQAV